MFPTDLSLESDICPSLLQQVCIPGREYGPAVALLMLEYFYIAWTSVCYLDFRIYSTLIRIEHRTWRLVYRAISFLQCYTVVISIGYVPQQDKRVFFFVEV